MLRTRSGRNKEVKQNSSEKEQATVEIFDLECSLSVRWHAPSGRTKVNLLSLRPITVLGDLQGVAASLVDKAFPTAARPDYLTSQEYYRFTPDDEFLSIPGDIAKTEFVFLVRYKGWEYKVLERELRASEDGNNLLVSVIEFESTALMLGQVGVRVSLISYPVVSVRKAYLKEIRERLESGLRPSCNQQNSEKGLQSSGSFDML